MTDNLWAGDNYDAEHETKNLKWLKCMLNVSSDMHIKRIVDGITYAQCGLIDGPGNLLAAYHAAVLMLHNLLSKGPTMVVDPEGTTRPVVIAIMYLHLTQRMGWDHWLGIIREKYKKGFTRTVIEDGIEKNIQISSACALSDAHKSAFNRTNWRLLSTVTE